MFRCDRCDLLKPMPPKFEDGQKHCRRCSDPLYPSEAQRLMGDDRAKAASDAISFLPYPVTSVFASDPAITGLSQLFLRLTRGGASKTIAVTGVNLSASDTWSSNNATHITVTPTVNSSTSVTLTISADGTTTRGDYSITFNGDVITPRGILKVR